MAHLIKHNDESVSAGKGDTPGDLHFYPCLSPHPQLSLPSHQGQRNLSLDHSSRKLGYTHPWWQPCKGSHKTAYRSHLDTHCTGKHCRCVHMEGGGRERNRCGAKILKNMMCVCMKQRNKYLCFEGQMVWEDIECILVTQWSDYRHILVMRTWQCGLGTQSCCMLLLPCMTQDACTPDSGNSHML